jgi:acyl transferase domain-containing protein
LEAGLSLEKIHGSSTSVYVGNLAADYSSLFTNDDETNTAYQATGMSGVMLSNRISWFYYLHGPSITLDTACSSSFVSLHLTCQSLLQDESEMVRRGSKLNKLYVTEKPTEPGRRCAITTQLNYDDHAIILARVFVS